MGQIRDDAPKPHGPIGEEVRRFSTLYSQDFAYTHCLNSDDATRCAEQLQRYIDHVRRKNASNEVRAF